MDLRDAPQALLAKVRAGVERRIQQFQQHGAHVPLAGIGCTPLPEAPLNSMEFPADAGDLDGAQFQKLEPFTLDALRGREGKCNAKANELA